jgi:hypothetical protein
MEYQTSAHALSKTASSQWLFKTHLAYAQVAPVVSNPDIQAGGVSLHKLL